MLRNTISAFLIFLLALSTVYASGDKDTCLVKEEVPSDGVNCYFMYLNDGFEITDSDNNTFNGQQFCSALDNNTLLATYWYTETTPSEAAAAQEIVDGLNCWDSSQDLLTGIPIPEFTTVTALVALAVASTFVYKKRKHL